MLRLRPLTLFLGALLALLVAAPAGANQAPSDPVVNQPPPSVVKGTVVTFTASATDPDAGDYVAGYLWDLDGDGTLETGGNPVHWTAPAPGIHTIVVRAFDTTYAGNPSGGYNDLTFKVTVRNQDPTASFTFSPGSPFSGDTVTFDASASSDPDGGGIAKYEWDLDGAPGIDATTTTPTVTRSYPFAGYLDVVLRVTDANAGAATAVRRISLAERSDGSADGGTGATDGTGTDDTSGDVGMDLGDLRPVPAKFSVRLDRRGAFSRVRTMRVRGLPAAARVRATCRGTGCPWKTRSVKVSKGAANLVPAFRSASLRPGVVIVVFATAGERLGKVARVTVSGPGRTRLELLCVRPGSSKPRSCS